MASARRAAVLLLAVPLLAAACGGSRRSAPTATTAPVTTQPTTTKAATTAATTTATTTNAPAAAACTTSDLSASVGATQAGVGHRATAYVLTNSSSAACRLDGYPGMAFLGGDGTVLRDTVERGSGYLFQDPGPSALMLRPGDEASFSLDWTAANGRVCSTSARVEITPPDEVAHLTLPSRITVCPGDPPTVSALVAGSGGAVTG